MSTCISRLYLKEEKQPETCACPVAATAVTLHLPFNHLVNSPCQFFTREAGQTTKAFRHAGFPLGPPCVRRVQIIATDWRVLPRPMSSAKMHPQPSNVLIPMRQSKRNCTPIRWCSRRTLVNVGSTTTCKRPSVSSAAGLQSTKRFAGDSSTSANGSGGVSSLKTFNGATSPAAQRFRVPSWRPWKPSSEPPFTGHLKGR
mmetsp:Transcript_88225/g.189336  ORF Transcript_88225/g.189336 Transcript_88225/m.189336 type:complete len:200 (-) Transcript_88225:137-736(-)